MTEPNTPISFFFINILTLTDSVQTQTILSVKSKKLKEKEIEMPAFVGYVQTF